MLKRIIILVILTVISSTWASNFAPNLFQDRDHAETSSQLVDELWVSYEDKLLEPVGFFAAYNEITPKELKLIDKVRLNVILRSFGQKMLLSEAVDKGGIDLKTAWALAIESDKHQQFAISLTEKDNKLILRLKKYLKKINNAKLLSPEKILDIWNHDPETADYENGDYHNKVRLFLFCRADRTYPCLFAMRDFYNQPVLNGSRLWTLPALGLSSRGYDYYQRNGQTPQGIHTMDSVMPSSDPYASFGEFRRVKLHWVPKMRGEVDTKRFLPASSHKELWWHEGNVARDAGRALLRIHGTGRLTPDTATNFYPHRPTSGCISTRELSYDGVKYIDQSLILGQLMKALDLEPSYQNEERIKGILHVIEIDNKKSKVTFKDLQSLGIAL